MLTNSLRCRAKVFIVAYQSLYNVVLLLLYCHILFSSCTNFFLYLEYTRQAHTLGPFHLLLSLPKTSSHQIFIWLTPLLPSNVFCSNVTLVRLSLSCLKSQILQQPSLICFQQPIHEQFIHSILLYILVIILFPLFHHQNTRFTRTEIFILVINEMEFLDQNTWCSPGQIGSRALCLMESKNESTDGSRIEKVEIY